ncbi:MAG: 50S ribosomal protein L17 [Candidatus Marinimicrobia bacterium]|nr:50S ribosomal protein L17 [Candidatus Neomarinimicrobiota bacterium]
MRHRKLTMKLGRNSAQRTALLQSVVTGLITRRQVRTTLGRAKAAQRVAERMMTLGKQGTLAARRRVIARLRSPRAAAILFDELAPAFQDRQGGYTRLIQLEPRPGDNAPQAILEWTETALPAPAPDAAPAPETK